MKTINLITCNSILEASLIKGNLENEGIQCFITNENFTGLMPYYNGIMGSGIQVMIFENDLENAKTIICPIITKELKCPFCNSESIEYGLGRSRTNKIWLIIISLIFWLPFGNIRNKYHCQDCKSDFTIP